MISVIEILKEVYEGIKVKDDSKMDVDVVAKSDDPVEDDFIINRSQQSTKIGKIKVYYGFKVNPNKNISQSEVTKIFNNIKARNSAISDEELYKLVVLTAPRESQIQKLIVLSSSSDLNSRLSDALSKKYNTPAEPFTTKKILYNTPKDVVNWEVYRKADPTSRKTIDTYVRSLEDIHGKNPEKPFSIKKSGYEIDGKTKAGIQRGVRRLLNPVYDLSGLNPEEIQNKKILVVDDFLVQGTSFKEVFSTLVNDFGVDENNILGYALAVK